MAQEMWRDVAGYEGFYQVSDLGRIRSVEHYDAIGHLHPSVIRKIHSNSNGYERINLCKHGVTKTYSVHRIVAAAFCERPEGMNVVNHIDNNTSNNKASNLEWTDDVGNMQHAARQGRMKGCPENLKKASESRKIPVIAISADGTTQWFESGAEAGRCLSLTSGHIAACCRQEYGYKRVGGYRFEYADRELQAAQKPRRRSLTDEELRESRLRAAKGRKPSRRTIEKAAEVNRRKVAQLDKDTNEIIRLYDSVSDAIRAMHTKGVSECLCGRSKTSCGYKWAYVEGAGR